MVGVWQSKRGKETLMWQVCVTWMAQRHLICISSSLMRVTASWPGQGGAIRCVWLPGREQAWPSDSRDGDGHDE